MTNDNFNSPTEAPRTPEAFVARQEPPALFLPSSSAGRANEEVDLYWNGPIHHLFIPNLSSPSLSRDDDTADESSMESMASSPPPLTLMPRLRPMMMPRAESDCSFLEITSISYPPMRSDEDLPSVTKGLNESCTTFDSTCCYSEHGYRSPAASDEENDYDDDASLAYSLDDDEASELTSEAHSIWHQPSPLRTKLSKVSEMEWDCKRMIPRQISVREDSWSPVLSSGFSFKPL